MGTFKGRIVDLERAQALDGETQLTVKLRPWTVQSYDDVAEALGDPDRVILVPSWMRRRWEEENDGNA